MAKPEQAWREKGIDIAAWKNERGGYSFTWRKMYKDKKSGEFKETKYLFAEDLDALENLLGQIKAWRNERRENKEAVELEYRASGADTMQQLLNNTAKAVSFNDDDIPF
jgi:hypothetical protein